MKGRRRMWGFKCKMCGRPTKELFNCYLTFEDKTVALPLCHKCMYRVGLKEKKIQDDQSLGT
jgi:hypothetical protein